MFRLLEQTATGVWLSTLISAAVAVATPIITTIVNSAVSLFAEAQLPEIASARCCAATWACQTLGVTTD